MSKYNYVVNKSDRKTIAIKINDDNTITVFCPKKTTNREVEKFLESKSSWIDRHMEENEERNNFLSDILNYKKILVGGISVPLIMGIEDCVSGFYVSLKSFKNLKKLYVDRFGAEFEGLFNQIKDRYGFECGKMAFRDYKSRWGSCDSKKQITFNYKLLMLDRSMWRYVICHELCHTKFMDHSPQFYDLLYKIMPSYRTVLKQMKTFAPICSLY